MARPLRHRGILVYNLLLHELSVINKNLPEDRKLSLAERRKLISEKLYPKYKNKGTYAIRLKPLRETLFKRIQRLPKKKGCNVLAIPLEVCQDIPYYEIEEFIRQKMPDCIFMMVNGDGFGWTKIFNTRDFNYYANGVAEITNRINEHVQKKSARKILSPGQRYFGQIGVIPGRPNNGKSDNYYLEMVLRGEDVEYESEPRSVKPPRVKKTKTQRKKERNIRSYVLEKIKSLRQEKSRIKQTRVRLEKMIYQTRQAAKMIPKDQRQKLLDSKYKQQIKKINDLYSSDQINQRQYDSLTSRLKKGFGKKK